MMMLEYSYYDEDKRMKRRNMKRTYKNYPIVLCIVFFAGSMIFSCNEKAQKAEKRSTTADRTKSKSPSYTAEDLIMAITEGREDSVLKMIDSGMDLNAEWKGQNPLNTAAAMNNVKIASKLLKKGANINIKDSDGWTPLATAAGKGNIEVMQLLIKKGADIDSTNSSGGTPLILACTTGKKRAVELLINSGADIKKTNKHGFGALQFAQNNGHKEIVALLKSKIEAQNE